MNVSQLQGVVLLLRAAKEKFLSRELSPIGYKDERETHLASALRAMAECCGMTLEDPLHVNSNGEFSLVVANPKGPARWYGSPPFGESFASYLTAHHARTGFPGPNTIDPSNGWCYLNHFDAERMVNAFYDHQIAQAQASLN